MGIESEKPHAVVIPYPAQSHIKAQLKVAKLLHQRGFYITFVNTEFNHIRFLKSLGTDSLDGLPDFRFEKIPDGLPLSDEDATQDIPSLCHSIINNFMLPPLLHLLRKLQQTSGVPPLACIVSDGFMPFSVAAGEELGIPVVLSFSIAACSFMGFTQYPVLKEKGLVPLNDEQDSSITNGILDMVIEWNIPGMKDIRFRDLPALFSPSQQIVFEFAMVSIQRANDASAIAFHTFDALEEQVLEALSTSMTPPIYTIGPLQLLLSRIPQQQQLSSHAIGYSLWKEETECLKWLDSKPPNSVVYVNFGSITVLTPQQVVEFGMGLAKSNHFFLWIVRPDLVVGKSAIVPPEFEDAVEERGMIASWCSQEEVLNHPSVGGFLTHCGWNSIAESLSSGVPMLCWPFFADQQTNCRFVCKDWEVGMEIDNDTKRDEIEKIVRELMEGEKGKKMKAKALEWKKLAEEAAAPHGSSSKNFDSLVNHLINFKKIDM